MSLPNFLLEERVIPVARGLTAATALPLAEALSEGGLSSIEVTMETAGAIDAIEALAETGVTTVGAGTVVSIDDAAAAVAAGASFMVSPHFDPYLVEWAAERDVFHLPGVFTPTEAAAALSIGADFVKLFPAASAGSDLVKSLLGPFPQLQIVATGGIDASNAAEYIAAGAVAVGVGSWLTGSRTPEEVVGRARQLRQVV